MQTTNKAYNGTQRGNKWRGLFRKLSIRTACFILLTEIIAATPIATWGNGSNSFEYGGHKVSCEACGGFAWYENCQNILGYGWCIDTALRVTSPDRYMRTKIEFGGAAVALNRCCNTTPKPPEEGSDLPQQVPLCYGGDC